MNKIPVVFITDNGFIMPTAVAITSLIKNKNKNTEYQIYIVSQNINDENKNTFKKLKTQGCTIDFIESNIEKFIGLHKFAAGGYLSASEAALLKFELPQLLPNSNKAIYLDGDTLILKDLSELYNYDLGDNYALACHDTGKLYSKNKYKLEFPDYFNSGVMVLNLDKMRKDQITNKLIETKKAIDDVNIMDQNAFNVVFEDKVKIVDIKWNVLITNLYRARNKWKIEQINQLFDSNYRNLNDIIKNAAIIHFASKDKPWIYKNVPCGKIWHKYFKNSPCKKIKLDLKNLAPAADSANMIQKIFSVKNDKNFHKTICILGIKIKFKNKIKMLENEVSKLNNDLKKINRERTILYKRGINERKVKYEIKTLKQKGIDENSNIVVSLTSYPKRMYDLHFCLYSLLNQTLKPKKIVLWLSREQFPNLKDDLGDNILDLEKFGVDIKFVDGDIKSYKKLIYGIERFPNNIIVTADDDIYYPVDWLERLYNSYLENPECIHCHRVHKISFKKDNNIESYKKWKKCIDDNSISFLNFLTGAGGVLYPPYSLYKDTVNEDIFMKLAPNADDVWFYSMAVLNNRKIKVIKNPYKTLIYTNPQRELNLNDDGTLYSSFNAKEQNGNDEQLKNVLNYYPKIKEVLLKEAFEKKV